MKKIEYATVKNPFISKVICGNCNKIYGRKTWNSTSKRFRRVIWRCNNKYPSKGVKGCDGKHIDNEILYKTFIDTFNRVIENIDEYMKKWEKQIQSEDILKRITAGRFIEIFEKAKPIEEFDVDIYSKLLEKIMVYNDKLTVTLLDGSEVEW
ncbi:MAG: hypothetical protein FH761_05640 [Firmicutes bacterium]|nr:hypothetical protein [Bacillota bacterium]